MANELYGNSEELRAAAPPLGTTMSKEPATVDGLMKLIDAVVNQARGVAPGDSCDWCLRPGDMRKVRAYAVLIEQAVPIVVSLTAAVELINAAQAVVDRWEAPLWVDSPPTAGFINRLRAALAAQPIEDSEESQKAAQRQRTEVASSSKDGLKPCPFCGATPLLENCRTIWAVRCVCEATMLGKRAPEPEDDNQPAGYWEGFRQTAIDSWNRREPLGDTEELPQGNCVTHPAYIDEQERRNRQSADDVEAIAMRSPIRPPQAELSDKELTAVWMHWQKHGIDGGLMQLMLAAIAADRALRAQSKDKP